MAGPAAVVAFPYLSGFDIHAYLRCPSKAVISALQVVYLSYLPDVSVVEGPEACLGNEELSLGNSARANGVLDCQYEGQNACRWWPVVYSVTFGICQKAWTSV